MRTILFRDKKLLHPQTNILALQSFPTLSIKNNNQNYLRKSSPKKPKPGLGDLSPLCGRKVLSATLVRGSPWWSLFRTCKGMPGRQLALSPKLPSKPFCFHTSMYFTPELRNGELLTATESSPCPDQMLQQPAAAGSVLRTGPNSRLNCRPVKQPDHCNG